MVYLLICGIISLLFGVLLKKFSDVSNEVILSTDEYVLAGRKVFGIIMLIAGFYILLTAYYIR